jgi:flagellar hook-basal body complex protein FliE
MSSIPGIAPLLPLASVNQADKIDPVTNEIDFAGFLKKELYKVDALQKNADVASIELATGQTQDLHTVMVALEKANLSLGLTIEVRNKVLDAYNQIMRMQI